MLRCLLGNVCCDWTCSICFTAPESSRQFVNRLKRLLMDTWRCAAGGSLFRKHQVRGFPTAVRRGTKTRKIRPDKRQMRCSHMLIPSHAVLERPGHRLSHCSIASMTCDNAIWLHFHASVNSTLDSFLQQDSTTLCVEALVSPPQRMLKRIYILPCPWISVSNHHSLRPLRLQYFKRTSH